MQEQKIKGGLIGAVVGDALGVPVEFMSRSYLRTNPVTNMRGYGTHNQPPGTWSDDTALTLCLVETIVEGFDIQILVQKFCNWYQYSYWTPHGYMFDCGISTAKAIDRLLKGASPTESGESGEYANGNGSLMRILPLAFYLQNRPINERFAVVSEVSALTHGHIRSKIACFFLVEFAIDLLKGQSKFAAFADAQNSVRDYINSLPCPDTEKELFIRIFYDNIAELPESEIFASGYVLHTLEASLWCFLNTNSFEEAVLKAVNLGDDADTTGAVTGGLAGIYYGLKSIPKKWITQLARSKEVMTLIEKFEEKI